MIASVANVGCLVGPKYVGGLLSAVPVFAFIRRTAAFGGLADKAAPIFRSVFINVRIRPGGRKSKCCESIKVCIYDSQLLEIVRVRFCAEGAAGIRSCV